MSDLDKAREEWVHYEGEESANAYLKEQQDRIAALTARCEELERELAATEAERYRVNVQAEQAEAALAAAEATIREKDGIIIAGLQETEQLEAALKATAADLEKWQDLDYGDCERAEQAEAKLAAERERAEMWEWVARHDIEVHADNYPKRHVGEREKSQLDWLLARYAARPAPEEET